MAQDVEQKIIDAALKLFSENGYYETSIRDIAREMKMTSASLYYYIKNKKDLLILIMDRYLKMTNEDMSKILEKHKNASVEEKLKLMIKYHVVSHAENQLAAKVVDSEYRSLEGDNRIEIKKMRDQYEGKWVDVLEAGMAEDDFKIENVKMVIFAILGLCTGVAHWYSAEGPLSIEEIGEEYATLCLKMVR